MSLAFTKDFLHHWSLQNRVTIVGTLTLKKIPSERICGAERQAYWVIFDFHQDKIMKMTLVPYESQLSYCLPNFTVQWLSDKSRISNELFISTKAPKVPTAVPSLHFSSARGPARGAVVIRSHNPGSDVPAAVSVTQKNTF